MVFHIDTRCDQRRSNAATYLEETLLIHLIESSKSLLDGRVVVLSMQVEDIHIRSQHLLAVRSFFNNLLLQ